MTPNEDPRCEQCGLVIGVYEPMVAIARGVPVRTSRAAGGSMPGDAQLFHAECLREDERAVAVHAPPLQRAH